MILRSQITSIGSIFKPHGIKGEVSASIDADIDLDELQCLVLDIDGIYVPFFIDDWRGRGSESVLIKFDGVDNEAEAAAFANKEVFAITEQLPQGDDDADDRLYFDDLVGYTIRDGHEEVGQVEMVDDSTANVLMHVRTASGDTVLLPLSEDLIEEIDAEHTTITMNLPQGLLDLN